MELGKAFTYVFDDPDWVTKLLIGGLLGMIPIVNLVVLGYAVKALRNVSEGSEQPLPAWDDFGDYFTKGLMVLLGGLVWAIPLIVLGVLSSLGTMAVYDPGTSQQASNPFGCCLWGLNCLSGIYGLFLGIVFPAAMTLYAVRDELGAFFRFGEIVAYIRNNVSNYVMAVLVMVVAGVIGSMGVILCCVGVVFTQFWANLVNSYVLGEVYRNSLVTVEEASIVEE